MAQYWKHQSQRMLENIQAESSAEADNEKTAKSHFFTPSEADAEENYISCESSDDDLNRDFQEDFV